VRVCNEMKLGRTIDQMPNNSSNAPSAGKFASRWPEYLRHTASSVALRASKGQKGQWEPVRAADEQAFYNAAYRREEFGTRRRFRTDDARLEDVAVLYRAAIGDNDTHPGKRIAAELHVSVEHARRLVGQARRKGFLGPALRGRAGEIHPTTKEVQRGRSRRTPT
jgi:hypothetical protein